MVPAGVTTAVLSDVTAHLTTGDTVIDGGNTHYADDIARAEQLLGQGIDYVDCGTSGGVWGLDRGFCLMIGGPEHVIARLDPIFRALAPGLEVAPRTPGREGEPAPEELGYLHCGPAGAGHFVKMVHNGIEYGLMAAYAEGFELLEKKDIIKDVPGAFKAWSRGTVVRSWLLDLLVTALEEDPSLSDVSGYTVDSGEGRWTVEEAIANSVPMPVISASLFARFASRQDESPTMKAVAALRGQFGGHAVMTVEEGKRLRKGEAPETPAQVKREAGEDKPAAEEAVHRGRKATSAGPSSGTGTTTSRGERQATRRTGTKGGRKAATAGPTSGSGST
jgi:6-phosphogluconate dehydrogenase